MFYPSTKFVPTSDPVLAGAFERQEGIPRNRCSKTSEFGLDCCEQTSLSRCQRVDVVPSGLLSHFYYNSHIVNVRQRLIEN